MTFKQIINNGKDKYKKTRTYYYFKNVLSNTSLYLINIILYKSVIYNIRLYIINII